VDVVEKAQFYYFCTKLGFLLSFGKFCTHVFQHITGRVMILAGQFL